MEQTAIQTIQTDICREKRERILTWLSTSESPESERFSVKHLFQYGVLPQSIFSLFLYHLRREIQEEASGRIDENSLSEEMITRMVLTPEHITSLLDSAIADAFDYCATPQHFLSDFLSEGKPVIALDDLFVMKLNALSDHQYFPDILHSWAENTVAHNITTIAVSELRSYIADIDRLILRHATISQIVDLLLPLYDFYNHRDANPHVDKEILIGFFQDKNLVEVTECLGQSEKTEFQIKELVKQLGTLMTPHIEVDNPAVNDSEVAPPSVETTPVLRYEEFLSDLREVGIVYQPAPVQSQYRIPFEVFISKKLRTRCIDRVFHGKEEAYRRFIEMIDRTDDFTTAKLNFDSTLRMHSVDIHSKVGTRLLEALKLRYRMTK